MRVGATFPAVFRSGQPSAPRLPRNYVRCPRAPALQGMQYLLLAARSILLPNLRSEHGRTTGRLSEGAVVGPSERGPRERPCSRGPRSAWCRAACALVLRSGVATAEASVPAHPTDVVRPLAIVQNSNTGRTSQHVQPHRGIGLRNSLLWVLKASPQRGLSCSPVASPRACASQVCAVVRSRLVTRPPAAVQLAGLEAWPRFCPTLPPLWRRCSLAVALRGFRPRLVACGSSGRLERPGMRGPHPRPPPRHVG